MTLFTALHRLLGRPPGPITDEMIDAAIAAELAETDDLDWKGELPPTKGLSGHDFPKDVAALANSGGGVIVYGVEEKEKRATGRKDVGDLTENHERTLLAAAYGAITPPVVGVRVHRLGEPGSRAVALVVPASTDGPHLIFRDKFFGAPVRNDADTEWMKERQIEAAYRARLDERRHATEVLDRLFEEARVNWTTASRAWLVAVAHPRLPLTATTRPTKEVAKAILAAAVPDALHWASRAGIHPLENVDRFNPRPGLRRWIAVNERIDAKSEWRSAWAAIHDDGSVSLASSVGGYPDVEGEGGRPNVVEGSTIECAVADLMALVRAASAHFGTSEYEVRVGIDRDERLGFGDDQPLIIRSVDNFGYPFDGTSLELWRYSPVSATVVADAAPLDYYWQVHDLARDCINQGGLTHVRLISPPEREG